MHRYKYNTTDRDELDAFLELICFDTTFNLDRGIVYFGNRPWRFRELLVAADCVSRDNVRNLM